MLRTSCICTLSLILSFLSVEAKMEVSDSLKQRLEQSIHDTDRINTLNRLSWNLMRTNTDTAIILGQEACKIAESVRWKHGTANAKNQLAVFQYFNGEYQNAVAYSKEAIQLYSELNKPKEVAKAQGYAGTFYNGLGDYRNAEKYYLLALKAEKIFGDEERISAILGNLGNVYSNLSDYPKSLTYYFEAMHLNDKMNRNVGLSLNYENIGTVYRLLDDFQEALAYYQKSLEIETELKNDDGIASNLTNIGAVYTDLDEHEDALIYYQRSLKIYERLERNYGISNNLGNIGLAYASIGNFETALTYYKQAYAMDTILGNRLGATRVLGNIGVALIKQGNFDEAKNVLTKAISASQAIGSLQYLQTQYRYLSMLYDTLDWPEMALKAYKHHIIFRDSINNEDNIKARTRVETKYEYEKAELLAQQAAADVLRIKNEKLNRRNNIQYSIILITLLIVFVAVLSLGFVRVSPKVAEGVIFFSFLILFEFILVLADPFIDTWSAGAPGYKLLFNAGLAGGIFPLHTFFERMLKLRLIRNKN